MTEEKVANVAVVVDKETSAFGKIVVATSQGHMYSMCGFSTQGVWFQNCMWGQQWGQS